jgi:hypothetical protein
MAYSDHFQQVSKQRLVRLVSGGAFAGILLDTGLFLAGIPGKMPFVLLGIIIILLIALIDWLDFHLEIFSRQNDR